MTFLTEYVRQEFHLLSVDKQRSFIFLDSELDKFNLEVNILYVDAEASEVTVRIGVKFNDTGRINTDIASD